MVAVKTALPRVQGLHACKKRPSREITTRVGDLEHREQNLNGETGLAGRAFTRAAGIRIYVEQGTR